MSKKWKWLSKDREQLPAIVVCFVACAVLCLIFLSAIFGIGKCTENACAPTKKIMILSLHCAQDCDAPDFVDAELRLTVTRGPFRKLYAWRNKVGRNKKACTWYLEQVIDAEDRVYVELIEIRMGAGGINRTLGQNEICDCSSELGERTLKLDKYALRWRKVKCSPAIAEPTPVSPLKNSSLHCPN